MRIKSELDFIEKETMNCYFLTEEEIKKLIRLQPITTFVTTREKTKAIATEKWFNHWTPFVTVKCQSGDKLQDSW